MSKIEQVNYEIYKKSYAFDREVYAVLNVSDTGKSVNSIVCHGVKFPVGRLINNTISNIHDDSKRQVTQKI